MRTAEPRVAAALGDAIDNIGERIHYVIAAVVLVSVLPAVISILRARKAVDPKREGQ